MAKAATLDRAEYDEEMGDAPSPSEGPQGGHAAPDAPERDEGHERALELARACALAADAKKAEDVVALDLDGLSDVADAIVVCTGANPRLVEAVADEVEDRAREGLGARLLSVEGRGEGRWVLLDFGSVVVHVLSPEARAFYRIERLWGDAPRLSLALA